MKNNIRSPNNFYLLEHQKNGEKKWRKKMEKINGKCKTNKFKKL